MFATLVTHDGVRELDGVASVEEHPTLDEVCVEFEDGSVDFFDAVESEVA